jgi:hypothetical protein
MNSLIEVEVRVQIPLRVALPHLLMQGANFGNVAFRRAFASQLAAQRFEHGHHLKHILGIDQGDGGDHRAAIRQQRDEPFGCENSDGFAQRRARNAEALREQPFVEPLAGRQLGASDELAQPVCDFSVQRPSIDGFD